MATTWLLTMLLCKGIASSCPQYYKVYRTEAECQIALTKWKESSGWWFWAGIRNGFCLPKQISESEIAVYESRKP